MDDTDFDALAGIPRRRALAAVFGVSSLALAGCASKSSLAGPSLGRVVVVGGGYGGTTCARYLRLWANVQVTLVEREPTFISCPASNLVIGGYKQISELTLGYQGLQAQGVRVLQAQAQAIDAAGRKLRLTDGRQLPYDHLVVAPGVEFMNDQVQGLESALASGRIVHAWQAGAQTVVLRRQLQAMRDGGVFAITIPHSPYRCPPGPYERACLVASYFKAAKPRSKVLILDANAEIQSKKALFEQVFQERYGRIIEYLPNSELTGVAGTTARLAFEDVKADVLNVVPPQRAGDIARDAGLITINQRWVGVDWLTMEATAAPGIHVLGDAVFSAPLMPKSGHMANQHAKVAAAAIIQQLQGRPVNPKPLMINTCYSFVSRDEAIHVSSVHQYDAAEQTMKTVPGSGGLSTASSEAEGRLALAWTQNIWHDMLSV